MVMHTPDPCGMTGRRGSVVGGEAVCGAGWFALHGLKLRRVVIMHTPDPCGMTGQKGSGVIGEAVCGEGWFALQGLRL